MKLTQAHVAQTPTTILPPSSNSYPSHHKPTFSWRQDSPSTHVTGQSYSVRTSRTKGLCSSYIALSHFTHNRSNSSLTPIPGSIPTGTTQTKAHCPRPTLIYMTNHHWWSHTSSSELPYTKSFLAICTTPPRITLLSIQHRRCHSSHRLILFPYRPQVSMY